MNVQQSTDLIRDAFWMAFWLSAPLLVVGFIAGVAISILQIVTSIQDASFGAVPRLVAFLLAIVVGLPWMLNRLLAYTVQLFGDFTIYAK